MPSKSILSVVRYSDPRVASQWLCQAFGFTVHRSVDRLEGGLAHVVLRLGDDLVLVGSSRDDNLLVEPDDAGNGSTQAYFVAPEEIDAHCARAAKAGAKIAIAPCDKDGGRYYMCRDREGHLWSFGRPPPGLMLEVIQRDASRRRLRKRLVAATVVVLAAAGIAVAVYDVEYPFAKSLTDLFARNGPVEAPRALPQQSAPPQQSALPKEAAPPKETKRASTSAAERLAAAEAKSAAERLAAAEAKSAAERLAAAEAKSIAERLAAAEAKSAAEHWPQPRPSPLPSDLPQPRPSPPPSDLPQPRPSPLNSAQHYSRRVCSSRRPCASSRMPNSRCVLRKPPVCSSSPTSKANSTTSPARRIWRRANSRSRFRRWRRCRPRLPIRVASSKN